jgi:hypothetical protein
LEAKNTETKEHPLMEEVELYWKPLWEEKVQQNEKAKWTRIEETEEINMNWSL